MADAIINDWLHDYDNLNDSEILSFASQHENNYEISKALFAVLYTERQKYPDLLHPVCNQFYGFYKSNQIQLRRFTLQFIPILVYLYLNSVSQGDKKSCRSIETLLIIVYNIEVSNDDGQPKIVSFRMPVLAQTSIYHEEKNLNSTDLRRWEENSNKEVKWGPLPQVESLNAQNRLKIISAILFAFNQQLSLIHKPALYHLCSISSQLVNQGFSKFGHAHRSSYGNDPNSPIVTKSTPRIPVSSKFLLELLNAAYFAMFNEFASIAKQTVDDIHERACYEMLSDVILVSNAIRNSLHANPSGQPSDGPMGISVALTPATTTVTVSKSMITNASFRTKKLPDDIPIIQGNKDDNTVPGPLLSITEEANDVESQTGTKHIALRTAKDVIKTHKVPFPGFKKLKDKEKDKKLNEVHKNGSSASLISSESIIIAKRPSGDSNKSNKFVTRNSLQMIMPTANDLEPTDGIGLSTTTRNSLINDISTTIPLEISTLNQIAMTNGTSISADDKRMATDIINISVDTIESLDSGNDLSLETEIISGTNDVNKYQGNIQVSQV